MRSVYAAWGCVDQVLNFFNSFPTSYWEPMVFQNIWDYTPLIWNLGMGLADPVQSFSRFGFRHSHDSGSWAEARSGTFGRHPVAKAHWPSLKGPPARLPQMQGVVMLKPAIDGPSSDPDRLTVVKTVDVAASKRQGVAPARKAKWLNLKGKLKGVFTGDPLSPRRFPASSETALFSSIYVSMSCGRPVEAY